MSNQPPITLSPSYPAATLTAGNTISVASGYAVSSLYTLGFNPSFTNDGVILSSVNTLNDPSNSAINLASGSATDQTRVINNGQITAVGYGVRISSGSGTGSTNAVVENYGTIIETQTIAGNGAAAGIAFGQGANNQGMTGTILNHGLIEGGWSGIYIKSFYKNAHDVITNYTGATISGANNFGLEINGFQGGSNPLLDTAIVTNQGIIDHGVALYVAVGSATLTNAGTITKDANGDAIISTNTGLLNLDPTQSIGGGIATFGAGSTLQLSGTPGQVGDLANPGSYLGFTTLTLAQNADWLLGTTGVATNLIRFTNITDASTLNLLGTLSTSSAITLTANGSGGFGTVNLGAGSTITESGANPLDGAAYANVIYANLSGATNPISLINQGDLTTSNGSGSGIKLEGASLTSTPLDALLTNVSTGTIAGGRYGVDFETAGASSSNSASSSAMMVNAGTIEGGLSTAAGFRAGVVFGRGTSGTLTNTGLINGETGYGVYFKNYGSGTDIVTNTSGGIIESALGSVSVFINQATSSSSAIQSANLFNAGLIQHGVGFLDVVGGTITNAGSIGTIGGSGTNANFAVVDNNQGVLNLDPTQSIGGGIATFGAGSTLQLSGTPGQVGDLANPGSYFGFTTLNVTSGADWTVGAAASVSSFNGLNALNDFGTLNIAGSLANTLGSSASINMEGNLAGVASVADFTGNNSNNALDNFGGNDKIVFASLASAGAGSSLSDNFNTATNILTVTETNAAGAVVGTSTVQVTGTSALNSASFVDIEGPGGATVALGSSQLTASPAGSLSTGGSIFIDYGQSVTLANTTGIDTIPVTFGTHGAIGALNTLDLNGTVAGSNSPYQGSISGFGLNDDIILGPSVLPSVATGSAITLSYSGSLLTASEVNAAGSVIGSTTLDVGTGYAANSFVALLGTNGVNIETPATVDENPLTFSATGTASFENPTNYTGGLAPGNSIVAGETVIIAAGTASIASSAPVNNDGTIEVTTANTGLIDSAPLTGNGTVVLGNGGVLTLANGTGTTTNTIVFGPASASAANTLSLDGNGPASFGGTITGIGANDTIDLGGSVLPTPSSASNITLNFNTSTDQLTLTDSVSGTLYTDRLQFAGVVPGTFAVSLVNGTIVITDIPCFAAGTKILTPRGQIAVEHLAIGDDVISARDGNVRKIIWTGQRRINLRQHPHPEKVTPVVIRAGAFGPGMPKRDLSLSPDHALFIDQHLIEVKNLLNGATIFQNNACATIDYHHIELDQHDALFAEGLAAESYLESGNRGNFSADASPIALHADFVTACRACACAPLLTDGPILRATRQKLLDRAEQFGFWRATQFDLTLRIANRVIPGRSTRRGEISFNLPANTTQITLLSSTGIPAHLAPDPTDHRVLGVALVSLTLHTASHAQIIDLLDPTHRGLHPPESGHRWTNGRAEITLPPTQGPATLTLTHHGQAPRWATHPNFPLSQIPAPVP